MPAPNMRDKILGTASQLFAFRGYSAVSMRQIATAAGMTQANLYHYFKDKEELIRAVLAFVFIGRSRSLSAALEGGADPEQRLERAISWFLKLLFEDAVLAKLFFRELLTDEKDRLKFLTENIFQDSFDTLVHILEDYVDTTDTMLSAIDLTCMLIGYFQFSRVIQHLHGAKPEYVEPDAITRRLMDQIRGLSKKQAFSPEVA